MPTNSFNMLPSGVFHNSADRLFVHAESARKRTHAYALCVLLTNIAYVLLSQPGLLHGFTAWAQLWMQSGVVLITAWQAVRMGARSVPPFCSHVCHVVVMGSQEQMIGAHTRRGITRVTNLYSWWNVAIRQLPYDAVRKALAMVRPYLPVPFVVTVTGPQPAGIGFVDFRPQPIFKRARVGLICARAAAVNLSRVVGGKGARTVWAGFVVYNPHVGSSFQAIVHATGVTAPRGFLMPNYTTEGSRVVYVS